MGFLLIRLIKFVRTNLYGQVTIQIKKFSLLNIPNLILLQKKKIILEERYIYDGNNKICRVIWEEPDPKEWGGTCPIIQVHIP